jgi:flagellar biosynthesis protein FlhG
MSDETETVSAAPTPQPRNPKIIAVASGKGGVGKTWCSIGLSHALSLSGKRVLLFDGDLGLANVDIQLGLMPEHDLGHVMLGEMSLKQSRIPYLDGGFDIIAGRSGSVSLSTLPASRLAWLREQINILSQDYDYIVLDLGAGIERTVRALASQAGTCVVVVTPDPTSLTDSYAYIKTIHSKPPYPDTRILVNLADTKMEGDKTYKTLQKACYNFLKLNPTLLGIVRRDKKVVDGIRAQQPILNFSPKSDAALDIKSAAALLA